MLKPMLAFQKLPDLEALQYPLWTSPKLDGIRCLVKDGVALSRSLKPIPNAFVQSKLSDPSLHGLDGELVVGPAHASNVFNVTTSGVMSREGTPEFTYLVFDRWDRGASPYDPEPLFQQQPHLQVHTARLIESPEALLSYEAEVLEQGYEGVILRDPRAGYKFGRSTLKEAALLKLKRFTDAEAMVTGYVEAFHNDNEAEVDNLGHTKRGHSKEGRTRGKGILGTLVCRMQGDPREFEIGIFRGITNEGKKFLWDIRETLPGKLVKFKYFQHGVKDLPRHAVFLGFRDAIDLS